MAIQFGGLATGLDTNSIVESLMNVERIPLERLNVDKTWQNNRLKALQDFDVKLKAFLGSVETLADREQYFKNKVTTGSADFFTATATNDALAGTSYQVQVESLAHVQKSYSNAIDGSGNDIGFSSRDGAILGTGSVVINVAGSDHTIELTSENNSLQGLMQAINDADIGVSAAIVNDGTASPYRLTLTGSSVDNAFSLDTSGLAGGTESFSAFDTTQTATQAHIIVDGLDIYSTSNTMTDAIPGVTLNLLKAESSTQTSLAVSSDESAVDANLKSFVAAYNAVVSFVHSQSVVGESKGGILGGDSGLNAVKRRLQNFLTTSVNQPGSPLQTLSELGLETQKDGTLVLNNEKLSEVRDQDFDSLVNLLAGDGEEMEGIANQFQGYLEALTDSRDGLYAGRSQAINDNLKRMDERIVQMEMRLEKREETLRSQFNVMEQLVSTMNSQSAFLSQQLDMISNLTTSNRNNR
ncbi:flagellar filament capping protein FliD [bacterium]|nr:flagellar filament capping protein FliD [bacterium]